MPRDFVLPGTTPRYAPDRPWNLSHVKIDLDLDFKKQSIAGRCILTLEAVRASDSLILDSFELDVRSVKVGRTEARFKNDGKRLRIALPKRCRRGQSITVSVDYSTTPRRGFYFVAPDSDYPDKRVHAWSQGQDDDSPFWFPCIDRPSMKATSEVIVRIPKTFKALSNGTLVSDSVKKGARQVHWRFDTPHSCYLITLVAGEFVVKKAKHPKVKVSYWLPPNKTADGLRTLERTPEMIDLFSDLFGVDYPYKKYAQVFVSDFIFGGMENTTATTLTDGILVDKRASLDFDIDRLIAHELAHQWFGDLITCRDWGQGWLNEGFATYCEYLWREHASGVDDAFIELDDWASAYFDEDSRRYRRTIATNLYDAPLDVFDCHLYQKGGRVLHMLRAYLGDADFFAALKHYLEKHRFGAVETSDLSRAIEESTGRSIDWFFDQWVVKGAGHPELAVRIRWLSETSCAEITIEQTQTRDATSTSTSTSTSTPTTPLFRLPMNVRFRLGQKNHDVSVEVSEERRVFVLPLSREPSQIILDPGKPTLAAVRWDKPEPLWIAELGSASAAADRISAAAQLGQSGSAAAIRSLVRSLDRDPFWGVKCHAAAALGKTRSPTAKTALLKRTAESDPRVRRAIVKALGEFRHDEEASGALTALLDAGDESYFVEAEAALALGRVRHTGALTTLERVSRRESFVDIIRRNVYAAVAELSDVDGLELLIDGMVRGNHPRGRCAAALAAARLTANRGDHHTRRVLERLEELLFDKDFLVQLAAVESLGILGDRGAIPALEDLAARDLDGRLRRRCREHIRDLRTLGQPNAELQALREEFDQIKAEAAELRIRVQRLEAPKSNVGKGARRPPSGKS